MSGDLAGRRILVTGGSMGIGLACARELASRGAHVVIAARGEQALQRALPELDGGGHHALALDVSDSAAWEGAMKAIDRAGPLHGLVAAAGVLGPIGRLQDVEAGELIRAIEINLLGTILALRHCLPRLERASGRAVTLSGGGAVSPLPRYDAYAASKAAVVRLTENVAGSAAIELNSVAPGFVATRMHQQTLRAGPQRAGADYYDRTVSQLAHGGAPAQDAAELVCFLLSDAARGISGRLLSAQWDPWRDEAFRERLRTDPSLATLRRIDEQFFAPMDR